MTVYSLRAYRVGVVDTPFKSHTHVSLRPLKTSWENMIKSPGARASAGQRISRLTLEQEAILETEFTKGKTLHETDLALLAAEMGAREMDVREWYIQRVATWRRSQGLSDCFGQI